MSTPLAEMEGMYMLLQSTTRNETGRNYYFQDKPYSTIYDDLKNVFNKPRYQDLLEDEWPQVENWFKVQIERAKKKK